MNSFIATLLFISDLLNFNQSSFVEIILASGIVTLYIVLFFFEIWEENVHILIIIIIYNETKTKATPANRPRKAF